MLKSKSNRLAVYDFKQSIIRLGWTFVWFLGITYFIPTLFSVAIDGNVGFKITNTAFTAVAALYLFIDTLMFNYDNFKWTIQNGVSRRTAWFARIKGLFLLALVVLIIDFIEKLIKGQNILVNSMFVGYQNHTFGTYLIAIVQLYLGFLMLASFGLAIGYFMALLSKRGKSIVIIGFPVVLVVVLTYLAKVLVQANINWDPIINFSKLILGYSDSSGNYNPLNGTIILLLWIIIWGGLSYWFSSKLRLRRD
ncbi:ABC transporter permease protein [Paucilactobacillus hokkaidonensis JCM 18461]|uniref:ABC transporter permease protein n=1 Tax=Paucilactobacillus hokkaidonensis JCM 18461 TaxID=1291742 RepID=A0A0A1GVS4_9LACO|nr:hypothetical protein [Paucilactobacillus hokkaidonensis]BAP86085.1 ABC transporter permease protein [Paucilactobacillus hokkaidonensis JCM 18461]